jgi:hypothetical protein
METPGLRSSSQPAGVNWHKQNSSGHDCILLARVYCFHPTLSRGKNCHYLCSCTKTRIGRTSVEGARTNGRAALVWPSDSMRTRGLCRCLGRVLSIVMNINAALVRQLIASQFPQWTHLPITAIEPGGWDNRTFRLGEEMSVRLPSSEGYVSQVAKEHHWLPRLAPCLPLPVPVPIALGHPSDSYPWHWSIYEWLKGESATVERIADLSQFAIALAEFLLALQRTDSSLGPPAGK